MSNITAEDLKLVAEYMGYEVTIKPRNINGSVVDAVFNYNGEVWYDPPKNDSQCIELMERFKIKAEWVKHRKAWVADQLLSTSSESINEAVTLAAIAYVKGIEE